MKAQERARFKAAGALSKPAFSEGENENDISVRGEEAARKILELKRAEAATLLSHGQDSISKPAESPQYAQISGSYASPPALKPNHHIPIEGGDSPQTAPVADENTASLVSPPTSLSDDMETALSQLNDSPNISLPNQRSSRVHTSPPSTILIDDSSIKISPVQGSHVRSDILPDSSPRTGPPIRVSRTKLSPPIDSSPTRTLATPAHVSAVISPRRPHRTSPLGDRELPGRQNQDDPSPPSPTGHSKVAQRDLTEADTDPESLRLIKELQEQEFSLRKRATRS